MNNLYISSIVVFLAVILLLVVILLIAKRYLVASGTVKININGEKELEVNSGDTLLNTLAQEGVYLPSACGGKGSCAQCKCQVVEGGGEILDSERGHFTRKQIKDNWRLGCQFKVKVISPSGFPRAYWVLKSGSAKLSQTRTWPPLSRSSL